MCGSARSEEWQSGRSGEVCPAGLRAGDSPSGLRTALLPVTINSSSGWQFPASSALRGYCKTKGLLGKANTLLENWSSQGPALSSPRNISPCATGASSGASRTPNHIDSCWELHVAKALQGPSQNFNFLTGGSVRIQAVLSTSRVLQVTPTAGFISPRWTHAWSAATINHITVTLSLLLGGKARHDAVPVGCLTAFVGLTLQTGAWGGTQISTEQRTA